jgi:hypothetical protein
LQLLVVSGGQCADQTSVHVYDAANNTWTALPNLNVARHAHAIASDGRQLLVCGGTDPEDVDLRSCERLKFTIDIDRLRTIATVWDTIAPMMQPGRSGLHLMPYAPDKFVVMGGQFFDEHRSRYTLLDNIEIIDLDTDKKNSAKDSAAWRASGVSLARPTAEHSVAFVPL